MGHGTCCHSVSGSSGISSKALVSSLPSQPKASTHCQHKKYIQNGLKCWVLEFELCVSVYLNVLCWPLINNIIKAE